VATAAKTYTNGWGSIGNVGPAKGRPNSSFSGMRNNSAKTRNSDWSDIHGKEKTTGAKRVKSKFNKTIEDIKNYDYSMMPGAMNLNNQNVEKYMEYDQFLNLVKREELQGG
jgi:hypothetical protein